MEPPATGHPDAEEIAAYISGGLRAGHRETLEAHLAECRECRAEVTTARRILRRPVWRQRLMVASLAAAAVLVLAVLVPNPPMEPTDVERAADPGAAPGLVVVSPAGSDPIRRPGLAFTWRSHPGDPRYRITIANSRGETVWSADTGDTTIAPPDSVGLVAGATYFWFVDALDTAGLAVSTGPRTLRVAP
jgi:anti-sigma factor RsiW